MVRSRIETHLFGNMEEDEESDYDHTIIDYSCAQGGDKKIVVLEKTVQTSLQEKRFRSNRVLTEFC